MIFKLSIGFALIYIYLYFEILPAKEDSSWSSVPS